MVLNSVCLFVCFLRPFAPLLTRFIVFECGNSAIRLLNPSQPPRRHAATGQAAQADKRDASARLLSTRQINKIRPWCAQTHPPRAKWCNSVLKKFFILCRKDFFLPGIHSFQWSKKDTCFILLLLLVFCVYINVKFQSEMFFLQQRRRLRATQRAHRLNWVQPSDDGGQKITGRRGINHAKPKPVTPSGQRQGPSLANAEILSDQFQEHKVSEIHSRKRRGRAQSVNISARPNGGTEPKLK